MPDKLAIIGIDSMDSMLVDRYIEKLPTLRQLRNENPPFNLKSVFPPDSDTAWASIYTGKNPAQHGIVKFIDPIDKSLQIQTEEADTETIGGRTFWDIAGNCGKNVCLLFPHLTYPSWEVNGMMISRSRIGDAIRYYPRSLALEDAGRFNAPVGVPKKDPATLKALLGEYRHLVEHETEFFAEHARRTDWDLFFCYSSALDAIQHYFWNFLEDEHENPEFADVIRDFYVLYDRMIARVTAEIDPAVPVIILSDHGHSGRPHTLIHVNEILRKNGFIGNEQNTAKNKMIDYLRFKGIEIIGTHDVGWIISKVFRLIPRMKHAYSPNPSSFNPTECIAYITDLSGIKAYTYGGIRINRNKCAGDGYEAIREEIIELITKELQNHVIWIKKREDLYSGEHLDMYPDILIQLKQGYGLGNKINTPLNTSAFTSSIVPGSHRGDTPIFFLKNINRKIIKTDISMMHIAPTVLDILGISGDGYGFDERSIFTDAPQ